MSVVTVGGLKLQPGAKFLQLRGGRMCEFELVEEYSGSMWIAPDTATGEKRLVYVGLP